MKTIAEAFEESVDFWAKSADGKYGNIWKGHRLKMMVSFNSSDDYYDVNVKSWTEVVARARKVRVTPIV